MGKQQPNFFFKKFLFNVKSDFKGGLFYGKTRFGGAKRQFWPFLVMIGKYLLHNAQNKINYRKMAKTAYWLC